MMESIKCYGAGFILWCMAAIFCAEHKLFADSPGAAPSTDVIPVADFFRLPMLESPKINRTGTHLVWLASDKEDHQVAVLYDLKTGGSRIVMGGGDRDIYRADWLDERRVLLSQSAEKRYAEGMFVADVNDKERTYPVERNSVALLVGVPRKRPLQPVVWFIQDAYNHGHDSGPAKINAAESIAVNSKTTGFMESRVQSGADPEAIAHVHARIVDTYPETPRGVNSQFLTGADGELEFVVMNEKGWCTLYILKENAWVRCSIDLEKYSVIDSGDNPGEIWAADMTHSGKPGPIVRLDAVSGQVIETVYQDSEYDCHDVALIRHPETGKIVGIRITRTASTTVWLDQGYAELQHKIEQLLPAMVVVIEGFDVSVEHVVVKAFSDVSPAAYYLVNLAKSRIDRIAVTVPWIDPSRMCKMKMMQYKTRDDIPVCGYLTLPAGASKQNPAPLVVLPHGGPWARDRWHWDDETQFLASRGYAVFQPNYRGSTGTQWRYSMADLWDFPKMSSDVTDGVKKILKTGLIDPHRVAIMGSSFGGYLALSGAVDEPDLYRCAVTISGVFDWALLIKSRRSNIYGSPLQYETMIRRLGEPRDEKEKFAALSPLNRLDRMKIPVFVAHGSGDEVVDYNQAKLLVSELKKRSIPCVSLIKGGEGHGMVRLEDRIELYTAVEAFLAENMRKQVDPTPTTP